MALSWSPFLKDPFNNFPNPSTAPNSTFASSQCPKPSFLRHWNVKLAATPHAKSNVHTAISHSSTADSRERPPTDSLRQLAASAILFIGLGIRVCLASASTRIPPSHVNNSPAVVEDYRIQDNDGVEKSGNMENLEDKGLKAAFETWKSQTYALTVPLRIVALRGSVPPSWIKDFMQSQGKRARLRSEIRGNLDDIFSNLCTSFTKGNFDHKSAAAADVVTVGDSWLKFAIQKGLIQPLERVDDEDWFKYLSDKWKEQ